MQKLTAIIDRYSKWLLPAAVIIIILLWQRGQDFKKSRDKWEANALFTSQQMSQVHNRYGQVIAEQKTAMAASAAQMKELSAQVFGLSDKLEKSIKQVQALVKIQQRFVVRDTVHADYIDSSRVPGDSLVRAKDVIIPPRKFFVQTDSYTIAGAVNLKNVDFDSISIPNRMALRIGLQKKGWFAPRRQIVQVINSNPYIEIEGMQSITLKPTASPWQQWIKPLVAAAITFFITTKIN